jgi:formylglycine-generating enzyme
MWDKLNWMILAAAMVLTAGIAQAVTIDLVPVGDINNAADTVTGYGSVDHAYAIGKYEVTAGQYTEFLNAKAKTDTYELYSTRMSDPVNCNIQRSGVSGSYTYSVADDYANRPVTYVSFWDAARFTNWLQNGQANGDTETGAYTLTSGDNTVTKNADAQWWIPSENEWYKAAYYKGDSTDAGYWLFPTSSNTAPGRDMTDVSGNNANFHGNGSPYPIDSGKYTTVVGEFQNSGSPYGTFDQGGNVMEWNDTIIWSVLWGSARGLRGGSYIDDVGCIGSYYRINVGGPPTDEYYDLGFRVASVPEPGSLIMLAGIALTALLYFWRKRA